MKLSHMHSLWAFWSNPALFGTPYHIMKQTTWKLEYARPQSRVSDTITYVLHIMDTIILEGTSCGTLKFFQGYGNLCHYSYRISNEPYLQSLNDYNFFFFFCDYNLKILGCLIHRWKCIEYTVHDCLFSKKRCYGRRRKGPMAKIYCYNKILMIIIIYLFIYFFWGREDEDKRRQGSGQISFVFQNYFFGHISKRSVHSLFGCMVIHLGPHLVYT